MKTQEEYLKSFSKCPSCNSEQIEGQSFDCDGSAVHQEVVCNDCEASWIDSYELHSYSIMEKGNFKQK